MTTKKSTTTSDRPTPKSPEIEKFFSLYKDQEPKEDDRDGEQEQIGPSGMMKLCEALKFEPSDVAIQLFLWHCKATTLYCVTRDEFVNGCIKFKVSNAEELREMLDKFKASLPKFPQNKLEEFWMFIFEYNREDKTKKVLQIDDACFFIDLILNGKKHVPALMQFLKEQWKKPVTRDQWRMMLEFSTTIKSDFSNYDETQSWPGMLDEFVEWAKESAEK